MTFASSSYGTRFGAAPPKRRGRTGLIVAGLALAVVVLGVVTYIDISPGGAKGACAIVIDRSESSSSEAAANRFADFAKSAIRGCAENDAAVKLFVFGDGRPGIRDHSPERGFRLFGERWKRSQQRKAQEDSNLEAAHEALDRIFGERGEPTLETDVVRAVRDAAGSLHETADRLGVRRRYLIVISDGLQKQADVSVESIADDNAPVQPLVDRVADLGLVADLADTEVIFAGPTAERGGKSVYPQAMLNKVHEFWSRLIEAGSGTLCYYGQPEGRTLPPTRCEADA